VNHTPYGIGANDWREADVVLLFDYHYLPQRIVIATAQGLMGHNATEGILSSTQHDKTSHPHVEALKAYSTCSVTVTRLLSAGWIASAEITRIFATRYVSSCGGASSSAQ
jgi:hypothetical protein